MIHHVLLRPAAILLLGFSGIAAYAAPAIVLIDRGGSNAARERLGNGDIDRVNHILTTDAANNSYLASSRATSDGWDWRTTKFRADGTTAWNAYYATNNVNYPYGIGVDAAGNVYVTGDADNNRYTTVKYSPNGAQLWMRHYDGPGNDIDQPRSMAVDAAGNVYVTGRSSGTDHPGTFDAYDYATVKYDTNGVEQWHQRYNPFALDDEAMAIAIDAAGSAYVTGYSKNASLKFDYATVKYDTNGVEKWVQRYSVPTKNSRANDIFVSGSVVTVTGTASGTGATTFQYDATLGTQLYVASHLGTGTAITGDGSGNIYVVGSTPSAHGYLTAKYDVGGLEQWAVGYTAHDTFGLNLGHSVAVDATGSVYVAGQVYRYVPDPGVSHDDYDILMYDSNGNPQWELSYDGLAGQTEDEQGALALRPDGVVVVAGIEAYDQNVGGTSDRRTTLFIADSPQVTVPQIDIAASVTGQSYAVNVSVRGKVGLPLGSVLVDDGEGHSCGIVLANGDGSCALANVTAGNKTVSANFASDTPALFLASIGSVTHAVGKATTTLTVSTSGHSHPGDSVTATVNFSVSAPGAGTPSGIISLGDGVDGCTVTPPANTCNVVLTTPGPRTLTASYAGDANFLASNATFPHRVNRVPVAVADDVTVLEDVSLSKDAASGVLSNDHDDDGDALSVANPGSFAASGIGGSVQLNANGSYTYLPPANANGSASFDYTLTDGIDTTVATVTLHVQPVNDPPTFNLGSDPHHAAGAAGPQSVPNFVTLLNTGPADESSQSYSAVLMQIDADPKGVLSSASLGLDGVLHYTLSGHGGTATLSVRVQDNGGRANGGVDTASAQTFHISVDPGVNLRIEAGNAYSFLRGGQSVSYTVFVSNLGNDPATQALVQIPVPANLTGFTWTCTRGDAQPCATPQGSGTVSQEVDVPLNSGVTFQITATVISLPEQPVQFNASVSAHAGQTELDSIDNAASDTDPVGIFANGFE